MQNIYRILYRNNNRIFTEPFPEHDYVQLILELDFYNELNQTFKFN